MKKEDGRLEQRYRTLFDSSHDGIYIVDSAGRFRDVNPSMTELFGYSDEEFRSIRHRNLFADLDTFRTLTDDVVGAGLLQDREVRMLHKDGRELSCLLTLAEEGVGDEERSGLHGLIRDVTDVRHVEERIQHAALHDSLTELPNRTFFLDRLRRLMERLNYQPDYRFAVLFIDLDRFKLVNDSLGHRAGDELLMMVAERLPLLVRPEDIVARFGGDEFTILLMDLDGVEDVEVIADRIQNGLRSEVFSVLDHELYVTASIGVALSNPEYDIAEELIRDADTAMYAAKDDGRGKWTLFDASLRERAVTRFATETALQHGLDREEFELYYQPLVDMESRQITGFEALLRWNHPERGLLPPAEFLPTAEETGLIIPIGAWVLAEACRVAAEWRDDMGKEAAPVMAVNLSARQLMDPGLGQLVRSILEETELPGELLRLEITETVLLKHSTAVHQTLSDLDELGVWLCLDDFGTGYSSLGYLRDLPVDVVKIDRSFVSAISSSDREAGNEMAEAILSLARRLGIAAVAEGVETEDQRSGLLKMGCGHAQGFLFSRPVSVGDARRLLDPVSSGSDD